MTMAQRKKPHLKNSRQETGGGKKRKNKQPTQTPAMQSVMVVGPTGKTTMTKRPW